MCTKCAPGVHQDSCSPGVHQVFTRCAPGVHYLGVHHVITVHQVCIRCAPGVHWGVHQVCTRCSELHYQIAGKTSFTGKKLLTAGRRYYAKLCSLRIKMRLHRLQQEFLHFCDRGGVTGECEGMQPMKYPKITVTKF